MNACCTAGETSPDFGRREETHPERTFGNPEGLHPKRSYISGNYSIQHYEL